MGEVTFICLYGWDFAWFRGDANMTFLFLLFWRDLADCGASEVYCGWVFVTCGISLFSTIPLFILITVLVSLASLHASVCSLSILTGSCSESHCINSAPSGKLGRPWLQFSYGLPCYCCFLISTFLNLLLPHSGVPSYPSFYTCYYSLLCSLLFII